MIDFGSFQQGYSDSEKDLAARRKENAALYANFVATNPGSSADEREKFAGSLAGNNKSFRAVLPTRSLMESNVAEYNRKSQLAKDQASRKLKLENIKIAGEATNYMADLLQTTDAETASTMTKEIYGTLISDDLLPSITAQANRVGWAKFQQEAAPLIQNFRENPSQANLDSLLREGYSQKWGNDLKKQFTSELQKAKDTAFVAANANILDMAQRVDLEDDNIFKSLMEAEYAKYNDLLTDQQKQQIELEGRAQLKLRRTELADTNKSKLKVIYKNVLDKVNTDGYETDAEIAEQLKLAIEADPDLKGTDPAQYMSDLEKALDDKRGEVLDEKNRLEEQDIITSTQAALANRQYSDENNLELIKNIIEGEVALNPDSDQASTQQNIDVAALSNQVATHLTAMGMYGINANDQSIVANITRSALDIRKREQGAEGTDAEVILDQSHFAQAYDEMLRSGEGLNDIERIAIQKALTEKGYAGMADVVKLGDRDFASEVEKQIKGMIRDQKDIFDQTETTLDAVKGNVNNEASQILSQIDRGDITEIIDTGAQLLSETVSSQNVISIQELGNKARTELNKVMVSASDLRSKADRLEQLAANDFYNNDRNAVKAARAEVDKLRKQADDLETVGEGIANTILDLKGRMTIASEGNPPNPEASQLPKIVSNYAAEVKVAMDNFTEQGVEKTPAEIANLVFARLQQTDKNLLPKTQYQGSIDNRRTSTGEVPYGPYQGQDINNPLDRLVSGGSEVTDYLTVMKMIFEELGMEMPTATEMRDAAGARTVEEQIIDPISGTYNSIVDRFNYAFPNFDLFENPLVDDDGNMNPIKILP
jgi:hypothetical protein